MKVTCRIEKAIEDGYVEISNFDNEDFPDVNWVELQFDSEFANVDSRVFHEAVRRAGGMDGFGTSYRRKYPILKPVMPPPGSVPKTYRKPDKDPLTVTCEVAQEGCIISATEYDTCSIQPVVVKSCDGFRDCVYVTVGSVSVLLDKYDLLEAIERASGIGYVD